MVLPCVRLDEFNIGSSCSVLAMMRAGELVRCFWRPGRDRGNYLSTPSKGLASITQRRLNARKRRSTFGSFAVKPGNPAP